MSLDISQIFDKIVELHKGYSLIHRRAISFGKYNVIRNIDLLELKTVKVNNVVIRESLLEHVGSLPVVATFLYSFLVQKEKIDLGRVLTMLAIHDIGETIVGDGHPHRKTKEDEKDEHKAAFVLLSENYHRVFTEFEEWESMDAKFARAVDVFSTFLSDQLLSPEVVEERFKQYGFSVAEIQEKRYKIFAWDPFLEELFVEVVKRFKRLNANL